LEFDDPLFLPRVLISCVIGNAVVLLLVFWLLFKNLQRTMLLYVQLTSMAEAVTAIAKAVARDKDNH